MPAPEDQVATVALRKESVDRNTRSREAAQQVHVALRKESVDRNPCSAPLLNFDVVALRKESVDRNACTSFAARTGSPSLSARRAWIEIVRRAVQWRVCVVALRKESVDRNWALIWWAVQQLRRSPQGERG